MLTPNSPLIPLTAPLAAPLSASPETAKTASSEASGFARLLALQLGKPVPPEGQALGMLFSLETDLEPRPVEDTPLKGRDRISLAESAGETTGQSGKRKNRLPEDWHLLIAGTLQWVRNDLLEPVGNTVQKEAAGPEAETAPDISTPHSSSAAAQSEAAPTSPGISAADENQPPESLDPQAPSEKEAQKAPATPAPQADSSRVSEVGMQPRTANYTSQAPAIIAPAKPKTPELLEPARPAQAHGIRPSKPDAAVEPDNVTRVQTAPPRPQILEAEVAQDPARAEIKPPLPTSSSRSGTVETEAQESAPGASEKTEAPYKGSAPVAPKSPQTHGFKAAQAPVREAIERSISPSTGQAVPAEVQSQKPAPEAGVSVETLRKDVAPAASRASHTLDAAATQVPVREATEQSVSPSTRQTQTVKNEAHKANLESSKNEEPHGKDVAPVTLRLAQFLEAKEVRVPVRIAVEQFTSSLPDQTLPVETQDQEPAPQVEGNEETLHMKAAQAAPRQSQTPVERFVSSSTDQTIPVKTEIDASAPEVGENIETLHKEAALTAPIQTKTVETEAQKTNPGNDKKVEAFHTEAAPTTLKQPHPFEATAQVPPRKEIEQPTPFSFSQNQAVETEAQMATPENREKTETLRKDVSSTVSRWLQTFDVVEAQVPADEATKGSEPPASPHRASLTGAEAHWSAPEAGKNVAALQKEAVQVAPRQAQFIEAAVAQTPPAHELAEQPDSSLSGQTQITGSEAQKSAPEVGETSREEAFLRSPQTSEPKVAQAPPDEGVEQPERSTPRQTIPVETEAQKSALKVSEKIGTLHEEVILAAPDQPQAAETKATQTLAHEPVERSVQRPSGQSRAVETETQQAAPETGENVGPHRNEATQTEPRPPQTFKAAVTQTRAPKAVERSESSISSQTQIAGSEAQKPASENNEKVETLRNEAVQAIPGQSQMPETKTAQVSARETVEQSGPPSTGRTQAVETEAHKANLENENGEKVETFHTEAGPAAPRAPRTPVGEQGQESGREASAKLPVVDTAPQAATLKADQPAAPAGLNSPEPVELRDPTKVSRFEKLSPQEAGGSAETGRSPREAPESSAPRESEIPGLEPTAKRPIENGPPRETRPSSPLTQVSRGIEEAIQSRRTSLKIDLHPEDLGSIQIRMSTEKEGLRVNISAERVSTGLLLERSLNELRQSLAEAGIHLGDLVVGYGGRENSPGDGLWRQETPKAAAKTEVRLTPQNAGIEAPEAKSRGGSNVDYRI